MFTDIYFALGSVFSSVNDRLRNNKKILCYATPGSEVTYGFLMSFNELNETVNHEKKTKILLIDRIENIKGTANIHCILLTKNEKYVNSLTIKTNSKSLPLDLYSPPIWWYV